MAITLLYHDVVERGQDDASGFAGAGAARYKLTCAEFLAHLQAIARATGGRPLTIAEFLKESPPGSQPLLTFDDGGVSAGLIARMLEQQGWRGHFFITADYIGMPGFVSAQLIRELRSRGHVIGSHSCSHPERMSFCSPEQLLYEWQKSCAVLGEIIGEAVTTASVPGGHYSGAVASSAARAGIKVLFNSEPTTRSQTIHGCLVMGRYTIYRGMSARAGAALAAGRLGARLRQSLTWKMKKIAKALGGRAYLSIRQRLLKRAYS